jgi:hypothetical protein
MILPSPISRVDDPIVGAIQRAVQEEIAKTTEEEITEAQKRIEVRVRERTAAIAGRVLSHFTFERMGQELRITVNFPKEA